jgi:hypothetical protein
MSRKGKFAQRESRLVFASSWEERGIEESDSNGYGVSFRVMKKIGNR